MSQKVSIIVWQKELHALTVNNNSHRPLYKLASHERGTFIKTASTHKYELLKHI
jgi:hypothetical protein